MTTIKKSLYFNSDTFLQDLMNNINIDNIIYHIEYFINKKGSSIYLNKAKQDLTIKDIKIILKDHPELPEYFI